MKELTLRTTRIRGGDCYPFAESGDQFLVDTLTQAFDIGGVN
jgi:hypothetical protein